VRHKLSIHDIARQLNVSATTISFVLNGKAGPMRISPSLEKKIRRHIRVKGYKPNSAARSLRSPVAYAPSPPYKSEPFCAFYHGSGAACL
jgi:DNA-binding LacI/PurR family transcriptional regulator